MLLLMLFLFFTQNCIYPSKHLLHCSLHIQGAIWVSFRFCCLFFFSCCDLTLSANAAKKKSKCRGQIFAQRSNFSTSDVSFSDRLCGEPIFNFAQSTSFSSSYICQHLENLKHNLDFFFLAFFADHPKLVLHLASRYHLTAWGAVLPNR